MKRFLNLFLVVCLLLPLYACTCEHEWKEATCDEPKICTKCEKSEGEALGHDWSEATCEKPKTCKRCGEIYGRALEHDWVDASCDKPQYCLNCGKQQGESLGHEKGEMNLLKFDNINAKMVYQSTCKRCNNTFNVEEKITSFIKDYNFNISPNDFAHRLDEKFGEIPSCTLMAQGSESNGYFGAAIGDRSTKNVIGAFMFTDSNKNDTVKNDNKDIEGFSAIIGTLDDSEKMAEIILATVLTIDPSLTMEEAIDVAQKALEYYLDGKVYAKNGIKYIFVYSNNSWYFSVTIEK